MNIFIVEDDSYKYSKVLALLEKLFPAGNFTHRDSVHGAIIYLRGFSPDLIILDMSLPSHSAIAGQGSPVSMPAGGIEIIMELKILKKTDIKIIILTQYPNVEIEYEYYSIAESEKIISELYGIHDVSVIYYDNDSSEWSENLNKALDIS